MTPRDPTGRRRRKRRRNPRSGICVPTNTIFMLGGLATVFLAIWNIRLCITHQSYLWETFPPGSSRSFQPSHLLSKDPDAIQILHPDRCLSPPQVPDNTTVSEGLQPPKGIVVTLLLGGENPQLQNGICHLFPSQLTHFIVPHSLDVLLVVSGNLKPEDLIRCLGLRVPASLPTFQGDGPPHRRQSHPEPTTTTWHNLDGSVLVTKEYLATTAFAGRPLSTKVYLSHQPDLPLPQHLWKGFSGGTPPDPWNQTRLETPLENLESSLLRRVWKGRPPIQPPACQAPPEYIQGTRWYTNEMLHLGLLQEYDYWVKLDPDVVFVGPLGFHLLDDLFRKGAVLGHTGAYPTHGRIPQPCSGGLSKALADYLEETETCAVPLHPEAINADRYYTNLLIGRVDVFQSEPILKWARWLSDYPQGFFEHRWTDQIFWQITLQLHFGQVVRAPHTVSFSSSSSSSSLVVADYTKLRCAPLADCWMSVLDLKEHTDLDVCENGGIFVHTKHALKWGSRWNRHLARKAPYDLSRTQLASEAWTDYQHDCRGTRWE